LITAVSIGGFLVVLATTATFAAKSVIRFGIVILLAGGVFSIISGSMLAARFSGAAESLSDRLTLYTTTLRAILDRPLLGFGLGSFSGVFPHYRGVEFAPNDPAYDYAHNIYLELFFESGIPGALLLIGAMVIIVGICIWGARSRHRNGYIPALGAAASLLVGGHGLFDFSLQIPAIAAVYCLILGVAYSQSWSTGLANRLTNE
jgi:O-antigen ligase